MFLVPRYTTQPCPVGMCSLFVVCFCVLLNYAYKTAFEATFTK